MFTALGRGVARHPLVWLAAWVILALGLGLGGPSREALEGREPASVLPADEPYNAALELGARAFPQAAARTRTILVFERPVGLRESDRAHVARIAGRLAAAAEGRWQVLSAATHPFLTARLISGDGQAEMIVVNQTVNFITRTCIAQVEEIEGIARDGLPDGLALEVTGAGGLGKDLSRATAQAYHRTTWVTVLAVLTILVLVYRAPLAALVPLVSIGVSVFVALRLLNVLVWAGWEAGDLERTFIVVLLFGSGTDFAMFWMSRYWESIGSSSHRLPGTRARALVGATGGTGPAIVASAATTIAGLSMLLAANLTPTHNAGRTLGLALFVSLVAALTLTPAIAGLMGRALFWPRRACATQAVPGVGVWARIAGGVVRRPVLVLAGAILLLAWPVHRGTRIEYRYDAFGVMPPDSGAARGQASVERHFSAEELFSWTILVHWSGTQPGDADPVSLARELSERCRGVEGVSDVWGLDAPLGGRSRGGIAGELTGAIAGPWYVHGEPPCVRAEIMQPDAPLSPEAMALCRRVVETVEAWAGRRIGDDATVHAIGLTPYIINVQDVSESDQRRVVTLVVVAIAIIVFAWVRKMALTACMVVATVGLYFATLGVADAVFATSAGGATLDWKVKLFLFVIMMAVGQDYNIFLVSRLLQERGGCSAREAARRGIARTGRVISSCGLIMAATLGSIAATGMPFYRQLGFAFAFGILLDTFVIRPAVVPACFLLTERLRSKSLDADT